MKQLIYLIDDSYLTIRVSGRIYKFRIDGAAAIETVEFFFKEIRQAENQFGGKADNIEPIVKILLASLNIADKYLKIKRKCSEEGQNNSDPYDRSANRKEIAWTETSFNQIVTSEEIDLLLKSIPATEAIGETTAFSPLNV